MLSIVKGFTLIELMVTIAIAGVLLSVGIPSLTSLYEGYRAESEIRKIQQYLMFARNQAVSYGSRVTMCPLTTSGCGSDWSNGFSIFIDNGTIGSLDTSNGRTDQVIKQIDVINSSDFLSFAANSVSFTSDGLIATGSSSGTFAYCPGSQTSPESKGVDVSPSGKVRFTLGSVTCTSTSN